MNKIIPLFFLFTLFIACNYDNEEELYPNPAPTVITDTTAIDTTVTISYANDIRPIITANCATSGCHVAGWQSPNLSSYNGLYANRSRVHYRAVEQHNSPMRMPPPSRPNLQETDVAKLKQWIEAGAPDN